VKHLKLMLSAVGILSCVGTALAFIEKPFRQCNLYCESTCTSLIDYKVASTGTANPCGGTRQEYVLRMGIECVPSAGPFQACL
jgi:hypothetical protein